MNRPPNENDTRRVAQLLCFDRTREDIVERLAAEGLNAGDCFLAYTAGRRFFDAVSKCDHGVPLKVTQRLSGAHSSPDVENCAECLKAEEQLRQRHEAETDAFIARLVVRKNGG